MTLRERMKQYEEVSKCYLERHTPAIIRIDGCRFSKFTRGLKKPFDENFMNVMTQTAKYLCENIQNIQMAYVASDEISLLLVDYTNPNTDAWFGYNTQKMTSVSASMTTLMFNKYWRDCSKQLFESYYAYMSKDDDDKDEYSYFEKFDEKNFKATFDARAFSLPKEEVVNYFVYRQQDTIRNSISSLARKYYSHKEIEGVNTTDLQEKILKAYRIDWNDCSVPQKYGVCIKRDTDRNWVVDDNIPIFFKDRDYINECVFV